MISKCIGLLSALLIIVGAAAGSFASVEWGFEHTLQMDQSPLDVAVSPDGKHIFVLSLSFPRKQFLDHTQGGERYGATKAGHTG